MKNRKILILAACVLLGTTAATTLIGCGNNTDVIVDEKVLTFSTKTETMKKGGEFVFGVLAGGKTIEGVAFASSNKAVILIDSANGTANAIGAGVSKITASVEGYATISVTVVVTDDSLKTMIIGGETTVEAGKSILLTASENGTEITSGLTWSSENTNIAIVLATGAVKGIKEGSTKIWVSKDGFNPATTTITVTKGDAAEVDTFSITFKKTVGVTFNADKQNAKEGDTVSFTITKATGITIDEVTMNDTVLTPDASEKYTFTMPKKDVIIRASVTIDSDVAVVGDLAFALVENEDHIFESEEISVVNDSDLTFAIKQADDSTRTLWLQDMDYARCFATIQIADGDAAFTLAGGFKYKFFYDASTNNSFIKRTQVITTPNNEVALSSLLDAGKFRYRYGLYKDDVRSVNYESTGTDTESIKYTWNKYKDNVTIATATEPVTNLAKGVEYKAINGDVLTYIDSYNNAKFDTTNNEDTTAKSGKYKVVASKSSDDPDRAYKVTTSDATALVNNGFAHDGLAIENLIYDSYRSGFSVGDDEWVGHILQSGSRDIKSVSNADGSFTTTLISNKTYNDSTNSYYAHFEYKAVITFNKDGSISSGTYNEQSFDKTAYDIANDKWLTGGKDKGTTLKDLKFSFAYSTELEAAPAFDITPYFIQSIDSATINNSKVNTDDSKNILQKGNVINDYLAINTFTPSTALDAWQYTVTATSDESIVKYLDTYRRWQVVGFGNVDLTLGNHVDTVVTKVVSVEVPNTVGVRNVYFDAGLSSYFDGIECTTAQAVTIYAGRKTNSILRVSPTSADDTQLHFEISDPSLLSVDYNAETNKFILDATNAVVTKNTVVTIKVTADNWDTEYGTGVVTLSITLVPAPTVTVEKVAGTWTGTYSGTNNASQYNLTMSSTETKTIGDVVYNKGKIVVTGSYSGTLEFGWKVENGELKFKSPDYLEFIDLDYDESTGKLGMFWMTEPGMSESEESVTTVHIGYYNEGDEDTQASYGYFDLTKSA